MACCDGGNDNGGSDEAKAMLTGLPLRHTVTTPGAGGACAPTLSVAPCVTNVPTCSIPLCNSCNFTPCRCSQPFTPAVARSVCGPTSCAPTAAFAQPYYQQVAVCAEDNRQIIRTEKLVGTFKNKAAFAMPTCGASIRVPFDRVGDVPVGAWLWSAGLGYLTIQGFNAETGEIELLNECNASCFDQAAPGTPIPKCSIFVILAPVCGGNVQTPGSLFPYLNSGFTAPPASGPGQCIGIAVTNTNGLSVNAQITINGGTYRISAIESATLITICNDGSGLTPGTVVDYKDANGNLIVPIVLIQSNVCLNAGVPSAAILGCHNNTQQPLVGNVEGQILVWNETAQEASWQTLGIPTLNCTELTVSLTLDPTLPVGTPYLVSVLDTTDFTVGDIVLIGATSFTVDSIPDGTHIYLIPVDHPVAIVVYNAGSTLCSAGCCEQLQVTLESYTVDNVDPTCSGPWMDTDSDTGISANIGATVISTGTPTATGAVGTMTLQNESCSKTMQVMVMFSWTWTFDQTAADNEATSLVARGYGDTGGGQVLLAELPNAYVYKTVLGLNRRTIVATIALPISIAPLGSAVLNARADLTWTAGSAGTTFTTNSQLARIAAYGVAVN